ncbi:MAG: hypothetical protein WC533_03295 [Candidatus Pacearchaeota archaeon]
MNLKIILLFVLSLLLCAEVSCLKISVYPAHININGNKGERICQKIIVLSDSKIEVYAEDKWAIATSKGRLSDYNLSSSYLGITAIYPKQISITKEKEIDFCIVSQKEGNYSGVLIFKSAEGYAGIGSLIQVEVYNPEMNLTTDNPIGLLTGGVISNMNNSPYISGVLMLSLSFFLIILLFLLRKQLNQQEKYKK